ncbi:PQQ-binding-like beta-propeller repeat protein [Methanosarcina sp. WH1]|uniref:outer membrane protein assembly factor BamB family protein n=1 Tax=Methanosarcina sp. WH1 TaxID=1434102 RepID=UPI000615829C|nr:PQQ-binding-like beta-propeller repeat protein [Methanosarcina sp. WH1]AKB22816.1 PQQ enzyme repeat domain protein [Methanosarcina sp. WH1]
MKKNIVVLVLIFLIVFSVGSGCISSDVMSSANTSSDEADENPGKSAGSEPNQENITPYKKSSPYLYWEYELGDVTPENILVGRSSIQDCVSFAPEGKSVAVGTGSNLTVIDMPEKNVLWEKALKGNISYIAFSKDGKYLLAGERGADGYIYSLDASTGDEIRVYRTADDLGTSTNPKYQPCIYRITAAENAVYIAAGRYWKDSGYGLASRVYRFSSDGTLLWKLPAVENYARSVNWIDSSQDGKNVVFSTGDWTNSLETDAVVYSVDENGKLRWKYEIPALRPYFVSAAIWHGLDVSEDGSLITAYTGDGRKYLFSDLEMKEPGDRESEWYSEEYQSNATVPEELEGSIIYTYGENAKIAAKNEVLYLTGATLPAYYPDKIPMAHPLENSLVSCNAETGEVSWTYNLGGRCAGIFFSPDMRFFILPVGKDTSAGNTQVHGVHAFDNQKSGNGNSKLLWTFNTEGVVVDAVISSDCTVAAVEVPLQLKNGDVTGKHRLIIVR